MGQGHWLSTLGDDNKGMDQRNNEDLGFRRDVAHNYQTCHTFWQLAVWGLLLFTSYGSGILV